MNNQVELDRSRMLGFRLGEAAATGSKVGEKKPIKSIVLAAKIGDKGPPIKVA